MVVVWAVTGPLYRYSDTWQLVINTGTSVVTFLMVFLIQNTQNRDAQAMQLKLNELIRAVSTARNIMVDLENCTEEEIKEISEEFADIRERLSARRDSDQQALNKNAETGSSASGHSALQLNLQYDPLVRTVSCSTLLELSPVDEMSSAPVPFSMFFARLISSDVSQ